MRKRLVTAIKSMLWQLKKYYICLHACVYVCVRALVVEVEWVHTHAMCMEAREKLPGSFLCHLGPWSKFRSSSWVASIFLLSHLKCFSTSFCNFFINLFFIYPYIHFLGIRPSVHTYEAIALPLNHQPQLTCRMLILSRKKSQVQNSGLLHCWISRIQ